MERQPTSEQEPRYEKATKRQLGITAASAREYVDDLYRRAVVAYEAGEPEESVRERFGLQGGMPIEAIKEMLERGSDER